MNEICGNEHYYSVRCWTIREHHPITLAMSLAETDGWIDGWMDGWMGMTGCWHITIYSSTLPPIRRRQRIRWYGTDTGALCT